MAAALLFVGGGAAVTYALVNQDSWPASPSDAAHGSLHSPMGHSNGTNAAPPNAGRSSQNDADVISRPAKIEIPSIDVTSPLITVGLDPDGAIQVPQPGRNYDKAAWFRGSPAPGEHGPAVIEGHVDGDVNGPSVFYRLGELQPSDQVRVTSVNGGVMHFEVYAVRLYPKSDFPTLKVYGNTRGPELRLITCGGSFDPNRTEGGYTSDVVVYAREV